MSNGSWGSHNASSHRDDKSVPKETMDGRTPAQKQVAKKRHKKKRRQRGIDHEQN